MTDIFDKMNTVMQEMALDGKWKLASVLIGMHPMTIRAKMEGSVEVVTTIHDEQFGLDSIIVRCVQPKELFLWLRGDLFEKDQKWPVTLMLDEPGDDVGHQFLPVPLVARKGQKFIIEITSSIEQDVMVVLSGTAVRANG